jgi:hypothetical protein
MRKVVHAPFLYTPNNVVCDTSLPASCIWLCPSHPFFYVVCSMQDHLRLYAKGNDHKTQPQCVKLAQFL